MKGKLRLKLQWGTWTLIRTILLLFLMFDHACMMVFVLESKLQYYEKLENGTIKKIHIKDGRKQTLQLK